MEIIEFLIFIKSELLIAVMIFLLLFIKVGKGMQNASLLLMVQLLLFVNILFSLFFNKDGALFGDMYITNSLIAAQKSMLSLGTFIISLLSAEWLKKHAHLPEFFILMLSSMLGMFFLISSGNLLMFYLSLELATIPVAALANFDLEKRKSSEAAMKLILSSAFSSGILLFGISLVYGATGTISFSQIPGQINHSGMEILAFIFLVSAFAFKLSAVPFHFWTADVYEGAPIAVTSYLSVISKGSIAFVFITALYKVFQPLNDVWYLLLMILSLSTMIVGNLFALRQQNMKRFLAFSSIAQVGFILMGISSNADLGTASVIYFVLIYVFSNLAAFGVASVISDQTGKEQINDYKGLYQTNPFLSWTMALALFSLAGIPPTAGFFGKLFLLTAGASKGSYWFVTIAALNLVISLYYYLNVVRVMFMDKNKRPIQSIRNTKAANLALGICLAGIVTVGLFSWFYEYIKSLL